MRWIRQAMASDSAGGVVIWLQGTKTHAPRLHSASHWLPPLDTSCTEPRLRPEVQPRHAGSVFRRPPALLTGRARGRGSLSHHGSSPGEAKSIMLLDYFLCRACCCSASSTSASDNPPRASSLHYQIGSLRHPPSAVTFPGSHSTLSIDVIHRSWLAILLSCRLTPLRPVTPSIGCCVVLAPFRHR